MSRAFHAKEILVLSLLAGISLCFVEASSECSPSKFKCSNGKCIDRSYVCDRDDDCGDKSDEKFCGRETRLPCPDGWVRCPSDDRCIPFHWVCDGIRDCDFGEEDEEASCTLQPCSISGLKCANGKCIHRRMLCDHNDDCGDNLDQKYCGLEVRLPCPDGWIHCPSTDRCIPSYFVCDGFKDCTGESEEKNCSSLPCSTVAFKCATGVCVNRIRVCDGTDDCGDNSDEQYCGVDPSLPCPTGYIRCPSANRCILSQWRCDGIVDCVGRLNEETDCGNNMTIPPFNAVPKPPSTSTANPPSTTTAKPSSATTAKPSSATTAKPSSATTAERQSTPDEETLGNPSAKSPNKISSKAELRSWFLRRRKAGSRTDRWGSQVHRMAVALHLADESTFGPGDRTGEEIRHALTGQLLHRRGKQQRLSSQELALYIHALMVSCLDSRDFYGDDLVKELRGRVETSGNYTNPFLILVLCNAGDTMTTRDVDRVSTAYDSQHRPFWTDYRALSSMALSCIASSPKGVSVDEHVLKDMLQELKRRQFRNGTVDNFRTTALVTQALFTHDSYKTDFDLNSAIKVLTEGLTVSRSLLDAYYALPVLSGKSLLNVTSGHCTKEPVAEEEALQRALDVSGETVAVHYSVWMGEEINVGRTWRLRVRVNSTVYDAIETVAKLDNRQKVEYNVVEGKPYVATLNGKEDDPEMGTFWFLYLKTLGSDKGPKMVEESPVDVKLQPNQEIILWYKRGPWSAQMHKSVTST